VSSRGIGGSGSLDVVPLRKLYNVVNFEYSSEALEHKILQKIMLKLDPVFCTKYEERLTSIRELDATVALRREKVGYFNFI